MKVEDMGRILITGDTHGDYSRIEVFKQVMRDSDYLIIAGDFGYLFRRTAERIEKFKTEFNSIQGTILFIDGNHENFDWLYEFPVVAYSGGKAHEILPNKVYHLMRGQVYKILNKSIFTFGGGRSVDVTGGIFEPDDAELEIKAYTARLIGKPYRINHLSWWKEEIQSQEEEIESLKNLNSVNYKVDYVITHCIGSHWYKRLEIELGILNMETDLVSDWLEVIEKRLKFKKWYFGHYHKDVELDKKHTMLYYNIEILK